MRASTSGSWRSETPVEMRFIDLFMATVGALVFMTMVLVAIVTNMPTEYETEKAATPPPRPDELRLVTKDLPNAQVGASYYAALAFRGGLAPFTWEIVGSVPTGLRFDTKDGIFDGIPVSSSNSPVLVRMHDAAGYGIERAYTLSVNRPVTPNRLSRWFAYSLLAILCLLALAGLIGAAELKTQIAQIEAAEQRGETEATFEKSTVGTTTFETVSVTEGKSEKQAQRKGALFFAGVCILLIGALAIYLAVMHYRG